MFISQKEILKNIFKLYENYVIMGCEGNPQMYERPIIEAIPELIRAFPHIVLFEMDDPFGVLKKIVMEKYKNK